MPAATLPLTVTADAAGRVTVDLGPGYAGSTVELHPAAPAPSTAGLPVRRPTVDRTRGPSAMTDDEYRANWERVFASGPLVPPPNDWDEPMPPLDRWCG